MKTITRRTAIAAALAGPTAGSASIAALATTSPDAELLRLGAEFDRYLAAFNAADADFDSAALLAGTTDTPEIEALGRAIEDMCDPLERAASRVMSIQPTTLEGLALWARMMCWRINADICAIPDQPPAEMNDLGMPEAFALAVAIKRMASHSAGLAS